jgi:hypothetical protein
MREQRTSYQNLALHFPTGNPQDLQLKEAVIEIDYFPSGDTLG